MQTHEEIHLELPDVGCVVHMRGSYCTLQQPQMVSSTYQDLIFRIYIYQIGNDLGLR